MPMQFFLKYLKIFFRKNLPIEGIFVHQCLEVKNYKCPNPASNVYHKLLTSLFYALYTLRNNPKNKLPDHCTV